MLNPERVGGLVLVNFNPQSDLWTNLSRLTGKVLQLIIDHMPKGKPLNGPLSRHCY